MKGPMLAAASIALLAALLVAPPARAAPGPTGPAFDCSSGSASTGGAGPNCTCKGAEDCLDMGQSGVCKGPTRCSGDTCTCDWRKPGSALPLRSQPQKR